MKQKNLGRIVFIQQRKKRNQQSRRNDFTMADKDRANARISGPPSTCAGTGVTVAGRAPGTDALRGGVFGWNLINQLSRRQTVCAFEKEFFTSIRPVLPQALRRPERGGQYVVFDVCSPLYSATNGAALRGTAGVVQCLILKLRKDNRIAQHGLSRGGFDRQRLRFRFAFIHEN